MQQKERQQTAADISHILCNIHLFRSMQYWRIIVTPIYQQFFILSKIYYLFLFVLSLNEDSKLYS